MVFVINYKKVEKRLVVFGGYNEKGFLNADSELLVLDSRLAVKIKK
jgi:hypothetical protein